MTGKIRQTLVVLFFWRSRPCFLISRDGYADTDAGQSQLLSHLSVRWDARHRIVDKWQTEKNLFNE